MITDLLIRIFGPRGAVLHGDPTSADRARWLTRHLKRGNHRTLDAGCGSGIFSLYAAGMGNQTVGVDFQSANILRAARRARILKLDCADFVPHDIRKLDEKIPELGQFDQVLCFEAIEHILDDRKLLRDLSSLLLPGGRLLLTTPFKHYVPLRGDHLSQTEDGGHVRWGYTLDEMRALMEEAGLRVVTEEFISGVISQKLTNLLRTLAEVSFGFAWLITLPLRALVAFDGVATRLFNYPCCSIGIVAEKPVTLGLKIAPTMKRPDAPLHNTI